MDVKSLIDNILGTKILRKVPEITAIFWIIKLLSTALGESTSDYLVHTINPVVAVILGAFGFTIAIILQLRVKKYVAWTYWLAVTMVAIFGTMAADVVHIVLGVPYLISTISFIVILTIIFMVWQRVERSLSIHSIITPRRELFYWAAVCTTFALGTALGDTTAITFNLGYLDSGILFTILFFLPLFFYGTTHKSEVLTFWISYIMTRPLGASYADWLGRTPDLGGIGFGTGRTSIILAASIIVLVVYISVKGRRKLI